MAKSKTLQAIVEIAGTLSPTLQEAVSDVTDKLDGINVKALAVGAAAAAVGVAVVKSVAEGSKALYNLGTAFQDAENTIRIGTGATDEALEELMDSFDEVYKSVPTSMEDASQAIADYNTRLGLTGEELENLSVQAIQVADMLGDDLGGVIEESSQAFQAWNIAAEDMGDAMDYVFKASQSTGTGFTDLMSDVQKFAPQMQELGYSFEEAVALIGQLDKAGVNADEVLGAMKKSVGSLAAEGIGAAEGLEMYAEQIKNAGDMAEATAIASEIFGSKAGSTMAAAIRDGSISVEELTASLLENGETINGAAEDTYTLADRMELFKQRAQVALEPLAGTLLDSITDLMPIVEDLMGQLIPVIEDLGASIMPIVEDLLPQIYPLISQLLPPILSMASTLASKVIPPVVKIVTKLVPLLLSILNAVMPIVETLVDTILPIAVQLIETLIPPITTIIMSLLPVVQQLLTAIVPIITQLFTALSPILAAVGELITSLLPPIISIIQALMPIITSVANIITGVLLVAFQALEPIIGVITDLISGFASLISDAFSGLVGIVKGPINAVISLVNSAINAINNISVDVPDWVPFVGGTHFGFDLPTIPMLASGGFTEGLSIAGEAGTEAVISFNKAYRRDNVGYWAEAGRMLGLYGDDTASALAGELLALDDFSLSGLATEGSTTIYDFSGMQYNPVVNTQDAGSGDIMQQLRLHADEFMDWLTAWTTRKGRVAYG
ncbi:MAG: phage tail tape measure protein [Lachnospiraceae bacterium]|nr:phage tail tape measure protein [Lachnospiraceae bacterium]